MFENLRPKRSPFLLLLTVPLTFGCKKDCDPVSWDAGEQLRITVLSDVEYSDETGPCIYPHPMLVTGDTFTLTGGMLVESEDNGCLSRLAMPVAPEPWAEVATLCQNGSYEGVTRYTVPTS